MTDQQFPANGSSFPREIKGGDVVLTLIPEQLYLEFKETLSPDEITAFLEQNRLKPMQRNAAVALRRLRVRCATGESTRKRSVDLCADARISTASPMYCRADLSPLDTATSFVAQILVHIVPSVAEKEITALFASLDLEIVASARFVTAGTLYQVRLQFPKRQDMFQVIDTLAGSTIVRDVGPDWIQLHSCISGLPNDTLFDKQWNLKQILAPAGWDITEGKENVIIAIIDSGCQLNHPDLVDKYVTVGKRYDAITGTNTPDDPLGHGTFCAGIAAAMTNNSTGVAGVAPNCLIMPIRLFDQERDGIHSEIDIVNAVNWARYNHADVINCSWSYDYPHTHADIAFEDAYNANIVIVAASGNCDNAFNCSAVLPIDYPASHPRVIAVGATDQCDKRQMQTNGFTPAWDSKYGLELSVMAPGILCPSTVLTTNTDTRLGPGYDTAFGTSAAAPHVAGLAALLMSLLQPAINLPPAMKTNDLVRFIIETTAAKVGGYNYSVDAAHPHGLWDIEMGYGRIDVAAALSYALKHHTVFPRLKHVDSNDWRVVTILFGLTRGGSGVVLTPGGKPVPVDPGWTQLSPEQWDVLLGLSVTELAKGVSDPDVRKALVQAGWTAIEQTARRIAPDG